MRMRKKKNIDARRDACGEYFAAAQPGQWRGDRGDSTPLYLEIGCGKGRFCVESARQMPECRYVAVEREQNVVVMAAEKAKAAGLSNLSFLSVDAAKLSEIFAPSEVDRIYLNFSDPWPPKKYWKRRLTHRRMLKLYDGVLKLGGELFFKTDNEDLFNFTMEELPQCGYEIRWFTHDLHAEDIPNIMTEYEENFSAKGFKIHRLEAVKVSDAPMQDSNDGE